MSKFENTYQRLEQLRTDREAKKQEAEMYHNKLMERMTVVDNQKAAVRLKMLQEQLRKSALSRSEVSSVKVGSSKVIRIHD